MSLKDTLKGLTSRIKEETDKIIEEKINLIMDDENATEKIDSFKEVADYIASDQSGALDMMTKINQNTTDITTLNNALSNLDEPIKTIKITVTVLEDGNKEFTITNYTEVEFINIVNNNYEKTAIILTGNYFDETLLSSEVLRCVSIGGPEYFYENENYKLYFRSLSPLYFTLEKKEQFAIASEVNDKIQEINEKIDDYHVELTILSEYNEDEDEVEYTSNYTDEELYDILLNKTPKHIKLSGSYVATDGEYSVLSLVYEFEATRHRIRYENSDVRLNFNLETTEGVIKSISMSDISKYTQSQIDSKLNVINNTLDGKDITLTATINVNEENENGYDLTIVSSNNQTPSYNLTINNIMNIGLIINGDYFTDIEHKFFVPCGNNANGYLFSNSKYIVAFNWDLTTITIKENEAGTDENVVKSLIENNDLENFGLALVTTKTTALGTPYVALPSEQETLLNFFKRIVNKETPNIAYIDLTFGIEYDENDNAYRSYERCYFEKYVSDTYPTASKYTFYFKGKQYRFWYTVDSEFTTFDSPANGNLEFVETYSTEKIDSLLESKANTSDLGSLAYQYVAVEKNDLLPTSSLVGRVHLAYNMGTVPNTGTLEKVYINLSIGSDGLTNRLSDFLNANNLISIRDYYYIFATENVKLYTFMDGYQAALYYVDAEGNGSYLLKEGEWGETVDTSQSWLEIPVNGEALNKTTNVMGTYQVGYLNEQISDFVFSKSNDRKFYVYTDSGFVEIYKDTLTNEEINDLLSTKANQTNLTNLETYLYAHEESQNQINSELNTKFDNISSSLESKVDSNDVYLKTETYSNVEIDQKETDLNEAINVALQTAKNYTDEVALGGTVDLSGYAKTSYVDEKIEAILGEGTNPDTIDSLKEVIDYVTANPNADLVASVQKNTTDISSLQDEVSNSLQNAKDYTDTQIANIDFPETDLSAYTKTVDLGNLAFKDSLNKADVGLGSVDNTSDANKPISTATQTALNSKANTADLKALAYKDGLSKSDVGLSSVRNVSSYSQTETDTLLGKKQNSLTTAQTNAVNSGITSTKVSNYDTAISDIATLKTSKADVSSLSNYQTTVDAEEDFDYTNGRIDSLSTNIATNTSNISSLQTKVAGKQDALTSSQLEAVNSGITASTWEFNANLSTSNALDILHKGLFYVHNATYISNSNFSITLNSSYGKIVPHNLLIHFPFEITLQKGTVITVYYGSDSSATPETLTFTNEVSYKTTIGDTIVIAYWVTYVVPVVNRTASLGYTPVNKAGDTVGQLKAEVDTFTDLGDSTARFNTVYAMYLNNGITNITVGKILEKDQVSFGTSPNVSPSTDTDIGYIRINGTDYHIYAPAISYTDNITSTYGTAIGTLNLGAYNSATLYTAKLYEYTFHCEWIDSDDNSMGYFVFSIPAYALMFSVGSYTIGSTGFTAIVKTLKTFFAKYSQTSFTSCQQASGEITTTDGTLNVFGVCYNASWDDIVVIANYDGVDYNYYRISDSTTQDGHVYKITTIRREIN